MFQAALLGVLKTLLTTLLTEKVLMNLLVTLASWFAERTSNDLDDKIVRAISHGLEHKEGKPQGSLYGRVRAKAAGDVA